MYIKINDGSVDKYPYSIEQLRKDNPNISFPLNITISTLNDYGVYKVIQTERPQVDYSKIVTEVPPTLLDEEWTQVWAVTDRSEEEIIQHQADMVNNKKQLRAEAYRNESDPLFFKAQRNEATMEEWLAKVEEIKSRYSY